MYLKKMISNTCVQIPNMILFSNSINVCCTIHKISIWVEYCMEFAHWWPTFSIIWCLLIKIPPIGCKRKKQSRQKDILKKSLKSRERHTVLTTFLCRTINRHDMKIPIEDLRWTGDDTF